jgi:hypothetical protein
MSDGTRQDATASSGKVQYMRRNWLRVRRQVNGFYLLASVSGLMTIVIAVLVLMQCLRLSPVRLFVPEVLPIVGLAGTFWAMITALLLVAGRWVGHRRPGGGGPGGGEPVPLPRRSSAPIPLRRVA